MQAHVAILVGPSLGTAKSRVLLGIDGLETRVWGVREDSNENAGADQESDEDEEEGAEAGSSADESESSAEEPEESDDDHEEDEDEGKIVVAMWEESRRSGACLFMRGHLSHDRCDCTSKVCASKARDRTKAHKGSLNSALSLNWRRGL